VTTPPTRAERQEAQPASEEVVEVAPGVLRLQLPIPLPGLKHVNTYALEDERGWTVVDPGMPGPMSFRALEQRCRTAGFRPQDVHTVVVTHSHPDHFGGAGKLREVAGADMVTSSRFVLWWDADDTDEADSVSAGRPSDAPTDPRELAELDADTAADEAHAHDHAHDHRDHSDHGGNGHGHDGGRDNGTIDDGLSERERHERVRRAWRQPTPWGGEPPRPPRRMRMKVRLLAPFRKRLFPTPRPSVRLGDTETIRLGRREWVALHTPGHTADHLCLYDPEGGVLLSGDHVLPSITPHISGIGAGPDPLAAFITSLDRVAGLDGVRHVLPAHGHPFTDLAGRVEDIKVHHDQRLERLKGYVAEVGEGTVTDLSHMLFKPRSWGPMAESETYAHLEHLRIAGDVERRDDPDGFRYAVR
jgi:glyoxylase-like metal-dependent hydrolase (beta-lactamase superfamily II)